MKNNFIYLLLFFSLIAQAQVTPSYPTIKLTKTVEGVKQDSLLVLAPDKTVKHIPYSKISSVHEYATASALPVTGVASKLYFIKDSNKIYTWNGTFYSEVLGAKGEKGDQGVAGIVGAKGDQGIQGPQGPQGIQGLKGDPGLQGDKGDVGLTGSIGLTGAKGDKGDIGLTGVAGSNGLDGAKGDKGDKGDQGIQGFKGDTGLTGADGAMGVQGPQGIQGIQGETGLRGIQGEIGPQGPIGFTGEKGADGTGVSIKGSFDNTSQLPASGADGDAYLISGNLHVWNGTAWVNVGNIQGPQGLIGLTGATGSQGIQGVKGDKGDQGIQGIQGLKGDTGAKGDTGSFNGYITADQVTETATRKFQTPTQSTYNDATGSIQGQLNSKENAFSKNTAFNKNFGTTAGTVVEGGTLGSNAYDSTAYLPINGTAYNSILWGGLDGDFTGSGSSLNLMIGRESTTGTAKSYTSTAVKSWLGLGSNAYTSTVIPTNTNQLVNGSGYITDISGKYDKTGGTISGNITLLGDIIGDGSAKLKTFWGGAYGGALQIKTDGFTSNRYARLGIVTSLGVFSGGLTIDDNLNADVTGTVTASPAILDTQLATFGQVKSIADTKVTLNGTGASGTWGINITGTAYNSTLWGSLDGDFTGSGSSLNLMIGRESTTGTAKSYTSAAVKSWLGLGSNAYTSTVIPTNTNHLTNGAGYVTDAAIANKVDKVSGKSLISDSEITRLATVVNQDISNKFDKTGGTISGNVSVTGTVTASGGFFNSDRRLKNILKRDGDVAYYTWKDGRDNKQHIGYVAQEVQKNHPDQVQEDGNGMLSVNYIELLVFKVRELEKRIEQLEKSK